MKYVLIDDCNTELFTEEFENKEQAIAYGDKEWSHLSERDKKRRTSYYLIESVNPDEEAEDHLDGDTIKEWK